MAKKPEIVSSPRRNSYHGLEDASMDWDFKDLLTIDATGEIRLVKNSDTKVLGLAQADAVGTVSSAAVVDELFDGDLIALDCYSTSDAAAKAASSFIPGDKYAIYRIGADGSGSYAWYAELENTAGLADTLVFVKALGDLRDTLSGTTITRGLFRLADGACINTAGN